MTMAVPGSNLNVNKVVMLPHEYITTYGKFISWQKSKKTNSFDEEIFLEFFLEAGETFKPTSLSLLYAMLKATIKCKHNVDIAEYKRLIGFLKEKNVSFERKINIFSDDELRRFLMEAPDVEYLGIKAATVLGIYGACRIEEITNVRVDMITDYGTEIIVRIPDSITKVMKVYSISGGFADTLRKYYRLRPHGIKTDRFFIKFRDGKCSGHVIGKKSILQMPRKIAEFLQLDDPDGYTGRSFRATSTKLTDTGVSNETTNRNPVADENSIEDEQDFNAADYAFTDTYDALQLRTEEDEICILDSSSEDDDDVIIIPTEHQNEIEFVDFAPLSNTTNVEDPCDSSTAQHNISLCESKIEDQVKEIIRLKQLTEKQSLEIEILKDLLQKSIKRNVRHESSRNIDDLDEYMSRIPAKVAKLDET